ncbi:MAG: hypothetical protein E2P04_05175 [Acidobacteria bacterium]|nr:MAG: hypothetical protein E2P04_05175 [Acidobacteriota bacterium]
MKIDRIHMTGFGALRGEVNFAGDRCNLILAPNESGKSTLVAAILTALYGLPEERHSRNRPITRRDAYRPWDGGPYGVEAHFTVAGRGYSLQRDLAADRVTLREAQTGKEITEEFRVSGGRYEILERLLQLERSDFVRSALVRQHEIHAIRDSADITHRLQRFATSQRGDITAGEALQALERSLARYRGRTLAGPGRVETELQRLDERLQAITDSLRTLEEERAAAEDKVAAANRLAQREEEITAQRELLDYLRTRAVVLEIERDLEERQRSAGRLEALRTERDDLEAYQRFPLDLMGEMNELRGKSQELTARIQEAGAGLEREVNRPLQEVHRELQSLAPLDGLLPDDEHTPAALALRMRDLEGRLEQKIQRTEAEDRRLQHEGVNRERARDLRDRLLALDPGRHRFLDGYGGQVMELQARRHELEELPLPDIFVASTGGSTATTAASALCLILGPLILVLAGWTRSALTLLLALLGIAALGAGFLLLRRRGALQRPPTHPEMFSLERELAELQERAQDCARRLGYRDVDKLLQDLRQYADLQRRTATLDRLQEGQQLLRQELAAAEEQAAELLSRAGRRAEPPTAPSVEALQGALELRQQHARRRDDLERRQLLGTQEASTLQRRLEGVGLRMDEILHLGGLRAQEQEPDVAAALTDDIFQRFTEAGQKAERYRHLVDELIPQAEAGGAPADWLAQRRLEKQTMEEELASIMERISLPSLPQPEHPSSQYVRDHKRTQERLDAVRKERQDAHDQVADLLRRYREEVPRLAQEREELQRARHRAHRFAGSVRLASEVLAEIARESYEEWATALNHRTSSILAHLNPGYRDIRFDTDLSFTLETVASGRRLDRNQVDAQLSSGARDQIYLAIRLAVCQLFSAGEIRTPLILDDVLATSDDARFDRALCFLAETLSRRHQVLLLSCQSERHLAWRARHPDLFDARFNLVELPSA